MSQPRVLAFVLAGGQGARLQPLTAERCKPAVPFGARHRIIDFALSNLINSNILAIYVLVQYKSQSLIEHLDANWQFSPALLEHFIVEVPPQQRVGAEWFQGTANALCQNVGLIRHHQPDLVAVLSADHIYRMDIGQMVDFHRSQRADASLAVVPVPRERARAFGIVDADTTGRIRGFLEKPLQPPAIPGHATHALASMGIYLFSTAVLLAILERARGTQQHDFGHDILPRLVDRQRLFAYDFATNRVPGVREYEEPAYWRDVGTVTAFWEAHCDLLGPRPRFELFNSHWPIHASRYDAPASKLLCRRIENSLIGSGSLCRAALIRECVIGQGSVIEDDAQLEQCIIMDDVRIGRNARLRRTIVDRYNIVPANSVIGHDADADRARYHVDPSDVVVLPRGQHTEPLY